MKIRPFRSTTTAFLFGLTVGALALPVPVRAGTYVVNTTDQRIDSGTNPCTVDHCSFWEAAITATMRPGPDRITFDLPGDPPYIIYIGDPENPGRVYPEITVWDDDTEIDGTTQPGGPIYLHGLGEAGWGMIVYSNHNSIRGLGFLGFNESGIAVAGDGNFLDRLIVGEYIGGGLIPAPTFNEEGIHLYGNDNTIRGVQVGNNGIGILSCGARSTVQDSHVGTIMEGGTRRGNDFGIDFRIGGGGTIERNTILGNEYGIFLSSGDNTVVRNYVGLDPATGAVIGNGTGITLENSTGSNIVGGIDAYEGNVIVDNRVGIEIDGVGQVLNNRIGLDFTGRAIPNRVGVSFYIHGDGNVLGSGYFGAGNIIANNTGDGVYVNSVEQILIEHNVIYNNGGHGINLFLDTRYAVLPGDGMKVTIRRNSIYGNGGAGINILDPAYANGVEPPSGLRYNGGIVIGTACVGCRVEVFVAAADPSGFGEGKTFLESGTAGSDGSFSIPVPGLRACSQITATATDAVGNTSMFSRNANALLCFRTTALMSWIVILGGAGAGTGLGLLIAVRRKPLTLRQVPWLILGAVVGGGLVVFFLSLPFVEIQWPSRQSQPPSNQGPTVATIPHPQGTDALKLTLTFISQATPTVWLPEAPNESTPTQTPTSSKPAATLLQNANCRRGPGAGYDIVTNLPQGLNVPIVGRNQDQSWWQVQVPGTQTQCWLAGGNVQTSGDLNGVPLVEPPPLGCWVKPAQGPNKCVVPCPQGAKPGGACTP
jgi:parallel beta-helix repeat protein